MYTIITNIPGYLPEDIDPWDTSEDAPSFAYDTFDDARRALIARMLEDADIADEAGRHNLAEALSAAAEHVNLVNTPDSVWVHDDEDPHDLGRVYEIRRVD